MIQSPQFLKQPSKFIKVAWDEIPETRDELARRFDECVGTSLAPQLQGQYWGRSKNLEHTAGRGNGMNGLVVRQNGNDHLNLSRPFNTRISYLKILALSLLREIASAEDNGEHQDNDTIDLQAEVQRFERELIRSALIQTGGRQRQAARLLRTKVTTLNTKIKKYRIQILEEASPKTNLQLIHPAKD